MVTQHEIMQDILIILYIYYKLTVNLAVKNYFVFFF